MPKEFWFTAPEMPDAAHHDDAPRSCWLFPGLGCRHVGMGHDLFNRGGAAGQLIELAEEALGYRLGPICLEGSGRKVVPPRQEAQVIYVLDCAYAAALAEQGHYPRAVLGHSLGSWAAAWAAGVYDFVTGLNLVTQVERLLEELIDGRDLTMGAVIGLDESMIQAEAAPYSGVTIANLNSPAQFVISGPGNEVDRVLQAAKDRGAKQAKRLPTTRAIHSPWMQEVAAQLKTQLDRVVWSTPKAPFIACDEFKALTSGAEVCHFFSTFLTNPVRWESSFRLLMQQHGCRFVEVGSGNLLTTLASFIDSKAVVRTATDCLEMAPDLRFTPPVWIK